LYFQDLVECKNPGKETTHMIKEVHDALIDGNFKIVRTAFFTEHPFNA
jgi:hypothetical protein